MKTTLTFVVSTVWSRLPRKRLACSLALAGALLGIPVCGFGQALYSIGVLDPASPYSEIRAVSQDGSYVVGTSRALGSSINVPVVWSLADGLVALPNPSGANSIAHGVSVGIGTFTGSIIISGLHENNTTHRFYVAPLNNLAGGLWVDTATSGGLGSAGNVRGGLANDLRSHPGNDGRWYTAGRQNDVGRNARLRGNANGTYTGWNGTAARSVNSVSAYGINVGRGNESTSLAFYEGPAQAYSTVPGSTGFRADGHGISPSFGISTTSQFDLQWICGQVQNYPGGNFQAFRWMRGNASMTFLGALPGDTSSTAYSIADNGLTVGFSFNSAGSIYNAVLWDTSGMWDTTGQPKLVKDLLEGAGLDTSAWTRLTRAYAVSDNGRVVAGIGIWAADGSTRGFVAVIPEPTTLTLLALGGLGALWVCRRRR